MPRISIAGRPGASELWPVLFLLLLVVLIPTACLLWLIGQAMQSERLAVRQKLVEAYRGNLTLLQSRIDEYWLSQVQAVHSLAREHSTAELFHACASTELADSLVCFDRQGQMIYPSTAHRPAGILPDDEQWAAAERLEFVELRPGAAATAYRRIAEPAHEPHLAALAWQAHARCLAKDGHEVEAVEVLTQVLADRRFSAALDPYGRCIRADALLRALELMQRNTYSSEQVSEIAKQLGELLADYRHSAVPSTQRLFLMHRLSELAPERANFPTMAAEVLAAQYAETGPLPPSEARVRPAGPDGIWQFSAPDDRVILLYTDARLRARLDALVQHHTRWAGGVRVDLRSGRDDSPVGSPLLTVGASQRLPGWQLALTLDDPQLLTETANRRVTVYLWTATLVIVSISIIVLLIAATFRRQQRLTRLKNDLLATVSHELKTPLASIRLLVDTLLEDEPFDQQQVREYLQMIAGENARLSRLIDNFLTFSRIQRSKYAFQFRAVEADEIVGPAIAGAGDRFGQPDCVLTTQVQPDMPLILADVDAMTTVLMNLLDNAYKYTGTHKRITLRAFCEEDQVCLEVGDNGIGLSPRDAQRVFERFFQGDTQGSRSQGGCGLGLSIVRSIVHAHGGTVRVTSRLGKGSVFTVSIPATAASTRHYAEAPAS